MNWEIVEGSWTQFKGKVKTKWAKLTDDDMAAIDGKREALIGRLQQRYGMKKDEAEKELDSWIQKM